MSRLHQLQLRSPLQCGYRTTAIGPMTLPILVLVCDRQAVERTLAPSALMHSFFLVSAKATCTQRFWGEGIPIEGASIRVELRERFGKTVRVGWNWMETLRSATRRSQSAQRCTLLGFPHWYDQDRQQKKKDGDITRRSFVKYNLKNKILSVVAVCYVFPTVQCRFARN